MRLLDELRASLRPVPVVPDVETLRRLWEYLYDTEESSAKEKAAYRAYQLATVEVAA